MFGTIKSTKLHILLISTVFYYSNTTTWYVTSSESSRKHEEFSPISASVFKFFELDTTFDGFLSSVIRIVGQTWVPIRLFTVSRYLRVPHWSNVSVMVDLRHGHGHDARRYSDGTIRSRILSSSAIACGLLPPRVPWSPHSSIPFIPFLGLSFHQVSPRRYTVTAVSFPSARLTRPRKRTSGVPSHDDWWLLGASGSWHAATYRFLPWGQPVLSVSRWYSHRGFIESLLKTESSKSPWVIDSQHHFWSI